MTTKLQALFNAIIVKQIEETESTYGSIIVPDMGKETTIRGLVYVVGPGHHTSNGNFLPTVVKPGDEVILPQAGPVKMQYKGQEYLICRENDIMAVISDRNVYYEGFDEEDLPF